MGQATESLCRCHAGAAKYQPRQVKCAARPGGVTMRATSQNVIPPTCLNSASNTTIGNHSPARTNGSPTTKFRP